MVEGFLFTFKLLVSQIGVEAIAFMVLVALYLVIVKGLKHVCLWHDPAQKIKGSYCIGKHQKQQCGF